MKLLRVGDPGKERPGVELLDGTRRDVSAFVHDYDPAFFAGDGLRRLYDTIGTSPSSLPVVDPSLRVGPPVRNPGKLVCIGLNYRKHATETGAAIPKEPIIFMKATSAINGPFDPILLPRDSEKTDWEVELAFVIGKKASYINKDAAMDYVAGYMVMNDVSERAYQIERGGQWTKGKSCDTFAPLGPYLVTKDDIPDPHNLKLWLKVNGEKRQDSSTSDLIFDIPTLVSYLSEFMTLHPGDIVSTGTPSGVGMGLKPPVFLRSGDVVELSVEGLGVARQEVRS